MGGAQAGGGRFLLTAEPIKAAANCRGHSEASGHRGPRKAEGGHGAKGTGEG